MATVLEVIGPRGGTAPLVYTLAERGTVDLQLVFARFNGAGASGPFRPTLTIRAQDGTLLGHLFPDQELAAGDSADVTYSPFFRRSTRAPAGQTYVQLVQFLAFNNDLRAWWRLGEGATPYADVSGYAPADPMTAIRVVSGTAMTQAFSPAAIPQDATAVAFNVAGSQLTPVNGDNLAGQCTTLLSRADFQGNLPYSVTCWVRPFASATAWTGSVLSTVQVHGFGTPGAKDDGYRIEMTWPARTIAFTRAPDVPNGGTYPSAVSPGGLPANTWAFIAGTYDGSTLRLYINGALVATQADAAAQTQSGSTGTVLLGIGTYDHGQYSAWQYGALAEASIWGVALAAADIAALAAAGGV